MLFITYRTSKTHFLSILSNDDCLQLQCIMTWAYVACDWHCGGCEAFFQWHTFTSCQPKSKQHNKQKRNNMDSYAKLMKPSYRVNWNTCNTRKGEIKCYVSRSWVIYNLQECRGDWRFVFLLQVDIPVILVQRRRGKTTSTLKETERDIRSHNTTNIIDLFTFSNTGIH